MQKPSIGRIVHVVIETQHGIQHRPAIVVNVFQNSDNRANLNPFYDHLNDDGARQTTLGSVPQDEEGKAVGTLALARKRSLIVQYLLVGFTQQEIDWLTSEMEMVNKKWQAEGRAPYARLETYLRAVCSRERTQSQIQELVPVLDGYASGH